MTGKLWLVQSPQEPVKVAAVLLAASLLASALAVQFGGKMKALFETADAEIDTVDSGL